MTLLYLSPYHYTFLTLQEMQNISIDISQTSVLFFFTGIEIQSDFILMN